MKFNVNAKGTKPTHVIHNSKRHLCGLSRVLNILFD